MSDINALQPHIVIEGERIPETLASGTTALDTINIEWGAETWYDDVEPSELKVSIYFELPRAHMVGQRIEITHDSPDGERSLFRGKITDVSTVFTPEYVDGVTRDRWLTSLTALDRLAEFAADRDQGIRYAPNDPDLGLIHWAPCSLAERFVELRARTGCKISPANNAQIPLTIEQIDQEAPTNEDGEQRTSSSAAQGYNETANVSVLTVLRRTARTNSLLARPYYDAADERIIMYDPPAEERIWITTTDEDLEIYPTNSYIIDGAEWYPAGGEIVADESTAQNITRIEHIVKSTGNVGQSPAGTPDEVREWSLIYNQVPAAPTLTVKLETDLRGRLVTLNPGTIQFGLTRNANLNGMFGLIAPAPITRTLDKHDPTEQFWLRAAPFDKPFFISRSIVNAHNAAARNAATGGTLEYDTETGWTVTLTLQPVPTQYVNDRDELHAIKSELTLGSPAAQASRALLADYHLVSTGSTYPYVIDPDRYK